MQAGPANHLAIKGDTIRCDNWTCGWKVAENASFI